MRYLSTIMSILSRTEHSALTEIGLVYIFDPVSDDSVWEDQ